MAPPILKLYVDPAWKREGIYSPLLFPFWGNPNGEDSLFAKEMFDAHSFDTSLYTITADIAEADFVLAPYRHNWYLRHDVLLLDACAKAAQRAHIPLLLDGVGDIEFPVGIENTYVLRIGGYRFLPEKGRIQIPPAADDLLERCCEGKVSIRRKEAGIPIVGFAGWAQLSAMQTLRTIVKEFPVRLRGMFDSRYRAMTKGVLWRAKALMILERSPLVALNLKKRRSFSGSAKTALGDLHGLRQDFVDTVLQSDYALDVRGDANDSTRLFEILSLGRIPVLVDTERPLPFSSSVDYRAFCLIVDFRDIQKIPERISEFHSQVSPERFEDMQRKAREAFVQYFRIDAQMMHIVRQINTMSVKG